MNLTIKNKLFGGFALVLLLLLGMALFMLKQFSNSNEQLHQIVDSSSRKVSLSNEVLQNTLEVSRLEKNLLVEDDSVIQAETRNRINNALESAEERTAALFTLVDDEGRQLLNNYQRNWQLYTSTLGDVMDHISQGGTNERLELSRQGEQFRSAGVDQLEALIEKNELDIQNERRESEENFNASVRFLLILVVFGILLAVGIAYSIIQGISRRIAGIARKAELIASREYTGEEIEDPVKDELRPIVSSLGSVNASFREVTENAEKVAAGQYHIDLEPRSPKDSLGHALKKMTFSLQESTSLNEEHNWFTTGQNKLNNRIMGNQDLEELANNVISFLADYLNASIGAFYLFDTQRKQLELKGQYAFNAGADHKSSFALHEGLIGQAASEKKPILVSDLSEEHLRITSSVLNAKPRQVLVVPFLFEEKVLGVLEMGKLTEFTAQEQEFLYSSMEGIALSVHSANARKKVQELLNETQVQSEELQSQQEELRQMNEELEEQTQNLKQQQEELQMTNEELEEQTQALEAKNKEIEAAKDDVEKKTKQLEISSKYKSEFLANMSHELRTPLNSLLILSKDLADNKLKNLNEDQIESAEIIYKSGHDLLMLINEVLDLSRVEAGKMSINPEDVRLKDFLNSLVRDFRHQAALKGLELKLDLGKDLPDYISTDPQRLNQILKNLLSNAIKFTEEGSVVLSVEKKNWNSLEISVTDTGIGIPEEKQLAVFEAFQQADGGTARKYGGTGLGLSISRELAKLLDASISLQSKPKEGATFTVSLPIKHQGVNGKTVAPVLVQPESVKVSEMKENYLNYPSISDDRESIGPDDKVVLIIEDDLKFAGILLKQANEKGFKGLTAASGEDGILLALKYRPHAIILDIDLPGMNGHQVLSEIKANPEIRHIPVHIASVNERSLSPIKEGAVEYLLKPIAKEELDEAFTRIENFVNRKMKNLLLIEDDSNSRKAIRKLIGNGDVKTLEAGSGAEALETYEKEEIDCIVLDLGLPDMSGFDLIYKLEKVNGKVPPIIIYTGKELSKEENEELEKYAESIIIKGVKSEERLLDETALFLHRTIKNLPESKQKMITGLYDKEAIFQKKKILVVDDDMRNVFALSKVLKDKGMQVIKAEHGKSALEIIDRDEEIDLVLMDIMMPEMDGYEAMRRIRQRPDFQQLPIIALTAKAMKDDKQRCIDAGANDYIAKPVDIERLLSLMQVWLSK